MGRAMELIITGRVIDAREAERIGLVNEVTPSGGCVERALELAEEIAALPQPAIRTDKEAAVRGFGRPLDEGLRIEAQCFNKLLQIAGDGRGGAPLRRARPSRPRRQGWHGDTGSRTVAGRSDRLAPETLGTSMLVAACVAEAHALAVAQARRADAEGQRQPLREPRRPRSPRSSKRPASTTRSSRPASCMTSSSTPSSSSKSCGPASETGSDRWSRR